MALGLLLSVGRAQRANADDTATACVEAFAALSDAAEYAGMFRLNELHRTVLRACPRDRQMAEDANRILRDTASAVGDTCRAAQATIDNVVFHDSKEGTRSLTESDLRKQDIAIEKLESACVKGVVDASRKRWAQSFAIRDERKAAAAREAAETKQTQAKRDEGGRQPEVGPHDDEARHEERAQHGAHDEPAASCEDAEQGLRKYLNARGVWDAVDATAMWLEKTKQACARAKHDELAKLVADANERLEKERQRERQSKADNDWAEIQARAAPAFKRAERAEDICANYRKIDANNALLTSKSEREVDQATGTTNTSLKRRVAAANMDIAKFIQGLKDEYVRAGGPKADTVHSEQFWCGYRSVSDVYTEERTRALRERAKGIR